VKITDVRPHVLSAPLREPIRMAHGTMRERTIALIEVVEASGMSGWGESWVNHARKRARAFAR
jgi:L-alanine-DL-glutamate epimerase-like enolase superfamily enzyme